jgi:4-amino-4-deoxy-L-arabinose transferase-like glycosyltransferase
VSRSAPRWWLGASVALFVVAVGVRALYALQFAGDLALSSDGGAYHDIASNLVTRHEFGTVFDAPHRLGIPYAVRPPLTPLLLAVLYRIFGIHLAVAQIAFALLGGASALATASLGRKIFSAPVAIIAGLLVAVDPFLVFLSATTLTENLAIFLYVIIVAALVKTRQSASAADAAVAGAVIGLAVLNKPTILAYLPFVFVWMGIVWRMEWRRGAAIVGATLAACLVVIAPWTTRNYLRTDALVLVTTQGGWNLYEANNPHTGYPLSRLEEGARGWREEPGYADPLRNLSPPEADRTGRRLAFEFIRDNPGTFARFAARKVRLFWSAYHHPVHQYSWTMIAALSCIGLVMTAAPAHRLLAPAYLLVLQTALVPVLFTSMPRFRAPIEPFLLLLAAVPIAAVVRRLVPSTVHFRNELWQPSA